MPREVFPEDYKKEMPPAPPQHVEYEGGIDYKPVDYWAEPLPPKHEDRKNPGKVLLPEQDSYNPSHDVLSVGRMEKEIDTAYKKSLPKTFFGENSVRVVGAEVKKQGDLVQTPEDAERIRKIKELAAEEKKQQEEPGLVGKMRSWFSKK